MFKTCRQCGELKTTGYFRTYYGGRKGTYTTCRLCEKINSREKYLTSKGSLSEEEDDELSKIHMLWQYQTSLGLRPPRVNKSTKMVASLDELVEVYANRAKALSGLVPVDTAPPPGLAKWLTEELTEEPEYYQEEVYEELSATYRPLLKIDPATLLPVYDDTYKAVLHSILTRFDDYEDTYYN